MEDLSLRLEFHRALDAVTPPAPWLAPRVRDRLRASRDEGRIKRAPSRPADITRPLWVVAMLLAVAIIVTLIVGSHLMRPKTVPVRTNPGAAATCPTWGFIPGGAKAPASIEMTSATTGWAPGDLRTTDGGAHWQDVSPSQLRSDEPYLPGQQTAYPPSYTDFFLDSNHAWLARSYDSSTACLDHVTTFGTTDGGQTWRASAPIALHLGAGAQPKPVLAFVDPQHGWLLLDSPPAPGHSVLYRTDNGGRSWTLTSTHGPSCATLVFSSTTSGWSSCGTPNASSTALLEVTHDGGVTWAQLNVATSSLPVFFDEKHGAGFVYASNNGVSSGAIYETSDGGASWQSASFSLPGGFEPYPVSVDFAGRTDFWIFVTPPGWFKGGIPTDWLYHSADGGATWQLVQKDTPVSAVTTLDFVDANNGFVLQPDPYTQLPQLLVTNDGGHTWSTVQVTVSTTPLTPVGPGSLVSRTDAGSHGSVYFVSPTVAWELTVPPDRLTTVVLRTTDSGAHWRLWGTAPVNMPPLAFSADEVVLSDSTNLVRSSDGVHWSTYPLPVVGSVSLLPDLQHGWAYGGLPTTALPPAKGGPPSVMGVWMTADGGATWRLQASGYIGDGSGTIAFWNPANGAILQGVSALLTHDAGVSWHQVSFGPSAAGSFVQSKPPIMFDAKHGVIELGAGAGQDFSRTDDGGLTWSTAQPYPRCQGCDGQVVLLDNQHALVLTSLAAFASADGGTSWRSVTPTTPGKGFTGVEVVAGYPGTAIVLAAGTYASETTDWGAHWKAVPLPDIYPSYSGFCGGGWQCSYF